VKQHKGSHLGAIPETIQSTVARQVGSIARLGRVSAGMTTGFRTNNESSATRTKARTREPNKRTNINNSPAQWRKWGTESDARWTDQSESVQLVETLCGRQTREKLEPARSYVRNSGRGKGLMPETRLTRRVCSPSRRVLHRVRRYEY
jgi:hypothetical protein